MAKREAEHVDYVDDLLAQIGPKALLQAFAGLLAGYATQLELMIEDERELGEVADAPRLREYRDACIEIQEASEKLEEYALIPEMEVFDYLLTERLLTGRGAEHMEANLFRPPQTPEELYAIRFGEIAEDSGAAERQYRQGWTGSPMSFVGRIEKWLASIRQTHRQGMGRGRPARLSANRR